MKTSAILRLCAWVVIALLALGMLSKGAPGINLPLTHSAARQDIRTPLQGESARVTDRVSKVHIAWVSGAVNVYFTEGNAIEYAETASRTLRDSEKLNSRLSGDTLTIEFTKAKRITSDFSKTLDVYIPESMSLRSLNISGVSNTTAVYGGKRASVSDVTVASVSGGITLEHMNANTVNIETVSGGASLSGVCERFQINTVSGDGRVSLTQMPKAIQGNSVSGSLTITIPENDGFTAKLTSLSGSIHSDFGEGSGAKNLVYKDGGATIQLSSISASITIHRGAAPDVPRETPASQERREQPKPAQTDEPNQSVPSTLRTF